jgi:flavin-binding protein dodecin
MTSGEVAELQGRSSTSIEDAIKRAVAGVNRTIQNVRCLWMKEQRVVVAGTGREYHVDMLVTFIGEDWQRVV